MSRAAGAPASLTVRLGRAFGMVAALVVVASAAVILFEVRHYQRMSVERSEALARGLARAVLRLDQQAGDPRVHFDDPRLLQALVEDFQVVGQDVIVIVDRDRRIVADSRPGNIGRPFDGDPGNEVGQTIADGRVRAFVETSADFPQGIHQVTVPLVASDGATQGAVIVDYERHWRATLEQVQGRMRGYALLGLLVLGAAIAATVVIGRALLAPMRSLAAGAEALARGEPITLAPTGRNDELGRLVDAFNATGARLTALLRHKDRDAARLQELAGELETRNRELATQNRELAQSMTRLERQNREIALRNELSDLLYACVDMHEAGDVIARYAPRLFPELSGAIYLLESGALPALARWGEPRLADRLTTADCWALRRGKPHRVTAASSAASCRHFAETPVGASLCVPLIAHGEALGLLSLCCDQPCGADSGCALHLDPDGAEAFAPSIGMALSNLRLRQSLREQSIRDTLTGLYNRRYLDESLDRELARAARERGPLAVFMLDVDHFKRFNDDYGHEAGDAVLRALGGVLRDNARAGDLPCRFGGEEFAVLLPGADGVAAREWGERLMRQVRAMPAEAGGVILPGITVSLGLALYPEHGVDGETLLQAADLALYDAKHAGRDRLVVSGEMI